MKDITIDVYNLVGSQLCVASDDGEKVYTLIKKALDEDKSLVISFRNISMITSAFLNAAIGQLYRDFQESVIEEKIRFTDIDPDDDEIVKKVKSTAKLFYENPERMEQSIREILGED
jgi:hypothetical protein